ncbi:hypothetical protein N9S22_01440 [Paracoccaceae bacterium]|nr:hypothetical protein [Paracoccaceae bacterium]
MAGADYESKNYFDNHSFNRTGFSVAMFVAPEFITREQFPNAEGQGFEDLVTIRYAIASLTLALVIITYHLRNSEGHAFQAHVMRGYTLAFSVVCITTLVLQLLGKISAVPPTVGTGIIAILFFVSWRSLAKVSGQN